MAVVAIGTAWMTAHISIDRSIHMSTHLSIHMYINRYGVEDCRVNALAPAVD